MAGCEENTSSKPSRSFALGQCAVSSKDCGRCTRCSARVKPGQPSASTSKASSRCGNSGSPAERIAHDLVKEFLRQPERERINRLDGGQLRALARGQDVIGMRHLQPRAVFLHAAGDKARLVEGQKPFDGASVAVEEHDVEAAAFVLANHAQGRPRRALRRRIIPDRLYQKRRDATWHRIADRRQRPAVEISRGQCHKRSSTRGAPRGFARSLVSSSSARGPSPLRLFSGSNSPSADCGAASCGRSGASGFARVMCNEDEHFSSPFQAGAASLNWKKSFMRRHYCKQFAGPRSRTSAPPPFSTLFERFANPVEFEKYEWALLQLT